MPSHRAVGDTWMPFCLEYLTEKTNVWFLKTCESEHRDTATLTGILEVVGHRIPTIRAAFELQEVFDLLHCLCVRKDLRCKRSELLPNLTDGQILGWDIEVFALFLK